ncbi:heavy metal translocating P-type ATPase [Candidatus Parabeggiatoa sp. HSG14]|uniref:heavy metal translocating P-type ATPase n=1 Tax=Candidatus Parabeggiatoa sp. HSG14 TaxID=3055593 RepID=UPI0025A84FAC|nr:heavy metal translocating P-type ATPase [Thiotrichales bacterium HSG14]
MLKDVGILLGIYVGIRVFENHKKKSGTQKLKFLKIKKIKKIKPIDKTELSFDAKNDTKNKEIDETVKQFDVLSKVSVINLGVATIRQFVYPGIAPLHLALLSYTNFSVLKKAETSLLEEKKVGHNMTAVLVSVTGLAISQYFAIALFQWLYYLGNQIVAKTTAHSQKLIIESFGQLPDKVWVLKEGSEVEISLAKINVNDIVVVNTGEVIPIDGLIADGSAMIDQHALTGEAQPAEKGVGERVFASTVVMSGKIHIRVEQAGEETTSFKITQILNNSAHFKTKIQLRGEKWADKIALPFIGASALSFLLLGPSIGLVVLASNFGNRIKIIGALGTLNHLNLAYKNGILIKDGRAIEALHQMDVMLFDKTGTLTDKIPQVGKIIRCADYGEKELLSYAATAERKVAHPIAKAIINKAEEFNLVLPDIDDSKYQMGYGITVHIKDKIICVGSVRFMGMEEITIPQEMEPAMAEAHAQGYSLVMVAVNHQLAGAIEIQASVRPEVKQIISDLRQHGIKHFAVVSGDHKHPTQKLADSLGMDGYFYDVLPEDKALIVEKLQKQGKSVGFVGDGINDVVAMKQANVSISLTGASSIATDVAEVILMNGTLSHLPELFEISKKLEGNLQNGLIVTLIPTFINIGGALFFNLGFTGAILIKNAMFFGGISNAMLPLLEKPKKEDKTKDKDDVKQLNTA